MSHTRRLFLAFALVAIAAAAAAGAVAATGKRVETTTKLEHGALRIHGGDASDKIALRLRAGEPGVLEVDVGDDGSADFSFERTDITEIAVNGGDGDDLVRIDESNGAVNAGIRTTLHGGSGSDSPIGASAAETARGGRGNDSMDANRAA